MEQNMEQNQNNTKKQINPIVFKILAIVLCAIIGVLANLSTSLQKEWFGRTVIIAQSTMASILNTIGLICFFVLF